MKISSYQTLLYSKGPSIDYTSCGMCAIGGNAGTVAAIGTAPDTGPTGCSHLCQAILQTLQRATGNYSSGAIEGPLLHGTSGIYVQYLYRMYPWIIPSHHHTASVWYHTINPKPNPNPCNTVPHGHECRGVLVTV